MSNRKKVNPLGSGDLTEVVDSSELGEPESDRAEPETSESPDPDDSSELSEPENDRAELQSCYATEQLKRLGIPVCDRCGNQLQTDIWGGPVCADNIPDCKHTQP